MRTVIGEAIVEIATDWSRFEKEIATGANRLKRFHDQLGGLAVVASAFGTLLTGAFTAAVMATSEFQQKMRNVQAVLGASSDAMKAMGDAALEMGQKTLYSAIEAAEGFYFLAKAGFSVQESIAMLPRIAEMAIATNFNLAESTQIVVNSMKAFGLATKETSRVTNLFAATCSTSLLMIDYLWRSIGYIGPVARASGIQIETLAAIMGTLRDAGVPASIAAVSLRTVLDSFVRETPKTNRILHNIGLRFSDISLKSNTFAESLDKLTKAGFKVNNAYEMFGKRGVSVAVALLAKGPHVIAEYEKKITGTNRAHEMATLQMDTLKASLTKLGNQFQVFLVNISQGTAGPLQRMVETLSSLVIGVSNAAKAVPGLSWVLGGLTFALQSVALAMGTVLGAIVLWGKVKGFLVATFSPWMWWVIGITTAIAALVWVVSSLTKAHESQLKLAQEVTAQVQEQGEELKGLVKDYNDLLSIQVKTTDQLKDMYIIIGKLRERYPELASEIVKLGNASKITAEFVEKLNDAQARKELLTRLKERSAIIEDMGVAETELGRASLIATGTTKAWTRWEEFRQKRVEKGLDLSEFEMKTYQDVAKSATGGMERWETAVGNVNQLRMKYRDVIGTIGALEEGFQKRGMKLPPSSVAWKTTPKPSFFEGDIAKLAPYITRMGEPTHRPKTEGLIPPYGPPIQPRREVTINTTVNVNGPIPTGAEARNLARDTASRVEEVVRRGEL